MNYGVAMVFSHQTSVDATIYNDYVLIAVGI